MEFSAKQISQFIQGRIEGDENVTINTFAKIAPFLPSSILAKVRREQSLFLQILNIYTISSKQNQASFLLMKTFNWIRK